MALMVRFLFFAGLFFSVSCVSTHTACPHCAGKKHSAVKEHKEHKGHSHSSTSASICSHCAKKRSASASASICSHCAKKRSASSSASICSHCAKKRSASASASICSHCAKKRSASASASICSHCAKKHSAAHKQGEQPPHSASSSACPHCAKKHSHAALEGASSKQTDSASSAVPEAGKSSVKPAGHSHHSAHSGKKGSALHRVVGDLSFTPINGPAFQLSALKKPKAIVIIMREKDCPISEKYGPRLARLEKKYAKQGIQFIYNYVGQVRTEDSAKRDLNTQKFKGPYAIDKTQKVVHALSAKTTGDVFILTSERKVVYRGPVDDQYHLLKSALKPKNHYVADILEAVVQGKAFTPKELPAPGCLISPPIGQTSS